MIHKELQYFLSHDLLSLLTQQSEQNNSNHHDDILKLYQQEITQDDVLRVLQYSIDHDFSRQQLKAIAKSIFGFPLELRILFANILTRYAHVLKTLRKGLPTVRIKEEYSIFEVWRAGKITPVQVFQAIQQAEFSGDLSSQECKMITDAVVCQGGFPPTILNGQFYIPQRILVQLHNIGDIFNINSMNSLSNTSNSLFLHSTKGYCVTLHVSEENMSSTAINNNIHENSINNDEAINHQHKYEEEINKQNICITVCQYTLADTPHSPGRWSWVHKSESHNPIYRQSIMPPTTNSPNSSVTRDACKPQLLVIGGCVRLRNRILYIDDVIKVGVERELDGSELMIVLFEGRWQHPPPLSSQQNNKNYTNCNSSTMTGTQQINSTTTITSARSVTAADNTEYDNDNDTELGSSSDNEHQGSIDSDQEDEEVMSIEGNNNNNNNNNNNGNIASTNTQFVHFIRTFYILIGTISSHDPIIQLKYLIPLEDMHKDQRPTSFYYLPDALKVIVSGTCGLFGSVSLPPINQSQQLHPMLMNSENKTGGAYILYQSFVSFTQDDSNTDSTSSHANTPSTTVNASLSHVSSASITCVDYSYRAGLLASADHYGILCVWRLCCLPHRHTTTNTSNGSISCPPLPSPTVILAYPPLLLHKRIFNVQFTPSGENLIVSLADCLYLIGIHTHFNTHQNLYIQAVLDRVDNLRAFYHVSFEKETEIMIIWRAMSSQYSGQNKSISVTIWKHNPPDFNTHTNKVNISHIHRESFISYILSDIIYDNKDATMTNYDHMIVDSTEVTMDVNIPERALILSPISNSTINYNSSQYYDTNHTNFYRDLVSYFNTDSSDIYNLVQNCLQILCAALLTARNESSYIPFGILISALDTVYNIETIQSILLGPLKYIVTIESNTQYIRPLHYDFLEWLCCNHRSGQEFWINQKEGYNRLTALYLKFCANKSISLEHHEHEYLKAHGPRYLYMCTRGLQSLTREIRKIDETANITTVLPYQIGYISGLQEIYARRVGLVGSIPSEFGLLRNLRVLSMGNNHLSGTLPSSLGALTMLQRIVLHQNKLTGYIPIELHKLGCIVNLAGNPGLEHAEDVSLIERNALIDLYYATKGPTAWNNKLHWDTTTHVSRWYKVGVLGNHVHSIVMSSNSMSGKLPSSISRLSQLRMIEFATMNSLTGPLPDEICLLTGLKRLCICRCNIKGPLPSNIGNLTALEELQLFGNTISGAIPKSISQLTSLRLLSLGEYTGGNSFYPATLPDSLSHLTQLEALFMANCNIKGHIPSWIGELKELRQLDLQHNQLSGPIPITIGHCTNLLYLNLKDNTALCGDLPIESFAKLTKLSRLSLVHCNFNRIDEVYHTLHARLSKCKIWI